MAARPARARSSTATSTSRSRSARSRLREADRAARRRPAPLTDGRWHHIAVTLADETATRLPRRRAARRRPRSPSPSPGDLLTAAAAPQGIGTVGFDELAIYPRALDAAADRRALRRLRQRSPAAPAGVRATAAANAVTLSWTAPAARPPRRRGYVAEAWQGTTLRGAQGTTATATSATLSGLPAGDVHDQGARRSTGSAPAARASAAATVTGAAGHLRGRGHRRRARALLASRRAQRHGRRRQLRPRPPRHATRIRTAAHLHRRDHERRRPRPRDGAGNWGSVDLVRRSPPATCRPATAPSRRWSGPPARARRCSSHGDVALALRGPGRGRGRRALALPAGDGRSITDGRGTTSRWPPTPGTLARYLDGERGRVRTRARSTRHRRAAHAARIPTGASVAYDELAIYPRALDAATIAAHFTASGCPPPATAPRRSRRSRPRRRTTTTRPKLAAGSASCPATSARAVVRVQRGEQLVLQREVHGVNGAWALPSCSRCPRAS